MTLSFCHRLSNRTGGFYYQKHFDTHLILCIFSLREKHGNDWATIGAALGRSAGSVRDRCRLMKDSCRYGTWQHDEEMRLANAVYELSGVQPGEEVSI